MRYQKGIYSVDFVMNFLILFTVTFIVIEVSRFMLTRALVDLSFREMVMESRVSHAKTLSSLTAEHFDDLRFVDRKDVKISSRYCSNMASYLAGTCSTGKGNPQDIVEYELRYEFDPILPLFSNVNRDTWSYKSIVVVRNEPDFEVSQW